MQLGKLVRHCQIDEAHRASQCNMKGAMTSPETDRGGKSHNVLGKARGGKKPPATLVWEFLKAMSPLILSLFNHHG